MWLIFILYFFQLNVKGQTNQTIYLLHKGYLREAIVHLPPNYNNSSSMPMILVFHGYGSNASQMQIYSQMDSVADTANFIAVYPNAINGAWEFPYTGSTYDDIGFISSLIDTLSKVYSVDKSRVYACGISMGGGMAYTSAIFLRNKVAACASVAGITADTLLKDFSKITPIPTLIIHGTADTIVPYTGNSIFLNIDTFANKIATSYICTNTLTDTINPGPAIWDNSWISKVYYTQCINNVKIVLYKIHNGGHTWPGAITIPSLGNTNYDIHASIEIWLFFKNFSNPIAGIEFQPNPPTSYHSPSFYFYQDGKFINYKEHFNLNIRGIKNTNSSEIQIILSPK